MQVAVRLLRHVVVKDDIDLLNVDTTAENLGSNQDTVLKLFEALVDLDSIIKSYTYRG